MTSAHSSRSHPTTTNNRLEAMVKIYVARHGQDIDNAHGILNGHRDEPLTDLGRQQAKDVARKMLQAGMTTLSSSSTATTSTGAETVLKAIYSSPLRRARETAEIFASILSSSTTEENVKVEILDDLIERNFGVLTGQPTSSIQDMCSAEDVLVTAKINYFLQPPGAETFPELIGRANRLLTHIQKITEAENDNSTASSTSILLVTHGDFGKMLYAAYYNLQWEDVLKQFHFGNSEVLLLAKDSSPDKAHIFETFQFNS
jgi:broad specificity phosphatase PhoE